MFLYYLLNMKYLVIFLFTAAAYAQPDVNVLGETAFEAIEINGYAISQIRSTHGAKSQIKTMFGKPDKTRVNTSVGKSYGYKYQEGFKIGFSTLSSGDAPLTSFEITDQNITVNISGISFSVGDNISVLSSLNLVENSGGNYLPNIEEYLIAPCEKCNHFIYITFNTSSQLITKVGYIELT